jgi:hypothetical protein
MLESSFEIFIQIVIPYLKITPDEIKMLDEDPDEFVNKSSDMCGERESDDIKTHVTELLDAI